MIGENKGALYRTFSCQPHCQCSKKVLSDRPGLSNFPVGPVDFIHHLSDGQVTFLDYLLG